jgi:hypothetical protein
MRRREFVTLFGGAATVALLFQTLAGQAQAPDQAVTVERVEVIRPGIYEIRSSAPEQGNAVSTGNMVKITGYKNVSVGTKIKASGVVIVAEVIVVGAPRHAKVPIKVVWHYPQPGLTNPESKTTTTSDEYMDAQIINEKFPIVWGLTQDWHLVPGTWTLEIWQGERKLATQQFQLMKP